eukprot:TRINITY_DN1491_c0_g2_i3.p1 TRINITY_DN1491_c0_g2~~TRINITY_DN1491_c0_g2_i3.p1  ORF type:complete len:391 (-),score=145.22 TRINITY_DN1491_c0_g2_i3:47-1135(-)
MSHIQLTNGAVSGMQNGNAVQEPVVQVLEIKQIQAQSNNSAPVRYRLNISDGVHSHVAMLATKLNDLVNNNQLVVNSIIKVCEFICNDVQGKKVFIVLRCDVLGLHDAPIGNPQPIESGGQQQAPQQNNNNNNNNNGYNNNNNNNNNNSNNNSNNNNNNNNSNNNNNNKEVSFASPSTDTPVTKSTGSSFLGKISSSTAPQGGSSYSSPAARSSTRSSTSSGPVHTDRRWVTVFGFVSTEVAAILRKFQSYGEIIHHHQEQGKNWVHIQFQTDLQAENALNRNGKLISDGMMIGVVPCSDQAAMSGGAKASVMLANTARRSAVNDPVAQGLSDYSVTITQSNQGPLPHKSLWSKIQEYVFDA